MNGVTSHVRAQFPVALAITALLFGASVNMGCGSSGTSPSSTPSPPPADPNIPNLAGNWTGTIQSSAFDTRTISALITQTADCVDGGWQTTPSEWNGAISGFATPTGFAGFLSVEGPPNGSGICPGVFRASGSATATGIKWTFENDGNCAGGVRQTVTFVLRR